MLLLSLFPPAFLVFACLAYVFWSTEKLDRRPGRKTRRDHLQDRLDVVYDNLRDLNFEFRAGKYIESDYVLQRNALEQEAEYLIEGIRRLDGLRKNLSPTSR